MAFASCNNSFPNSFRLSISQNKTPKIHNTSTFVTRSDLITKPPLISVPQKWTIAKDMNLLPCNNILSKYPCSADLSVYKDVVSKVGEDPSEGLKIVDAIQRLGIDYIFHDEIEGILQKQFMLFSDRYRARAFQHEHVDDLREIALRFRLLRQQGYFVPADVFNNFKDKNGIFSEKLNENIYGLIGLYEATQLSIEREYVLEEAELFSGQLLKTSLARLDNVQARFVANALENPCHKSLAKFTAKGLFGGTHQSVNEWINVLQGLAKVEFNKGQSLHRKEIVQISQWWRDLGLAKELRFARDQPLKWYIWSMACLTDPILSQHRVELTKPISFIYIIDDIFDVYGTLDQLTLFTDSINRWDMASAEKLPDYMKICFKALDNLTNEISYKVYQNHGWNPLHSLRNAWANLCNAFLVEARWFATGHVPSTEEYLRNGVVSSGVHVVLVHVFYLVGQGITQETSNFVDNMPGIVTSTAAILRLWDDLGSAKDENQEGHDGSYVDCYIKERQGSSVEEAREHIRNKISEAWKCLNKECLFAQNNNNNNIPLPPTFLKASLNLARLVPLMYSYDDNQCLPSLEEHVKSMLYESAHV